MSKTYTFRLEKKCHNGKKNGQSKNMYRDILKHQRLFKPCGLKN